VAFVAARRVLVSGGKLGLLDLDSGCFADLGAAPRDFAFDRERQRIVSVDGAQLTSRPLDGPSTAIAAPAVAVDLAGSLLADLELGHDLVVRDAVTLAERARLVGGHSQLGNAHVVAMRPAGGAIAAGAARCTPWKGPAGVLPGPPNCKVFLVVVDANAKETARFDADAYALAWSPDGAKLAIGTPAGLEVWTEKTRLRETFTRDGWVHGVAWSNDGAVVAYASWDGFVHLHDATGKQLRRIGFGAKP